MPALRRTFSSLTLAAFITGTVISTSPTLMAQATQPDKPQEGGQPPASGGVNTGGVHAPVLDQQHRPITAGGFVKTGPIVFQNIAEKAGLTTWKHTMGTPEKHFIIEANGSGVGLIDYDNDGWLDIYFVNGSTFEAEAGRAPAPKAALFHNNHDGTFTNVADKAGVTNDRWGVGVAIADYDNDGWPDIYVSNFGKNRLYHNNHDGTFTDVAEKAGVTLGNWSTGATWGDYDGDGKLDLFVPGYIHYDMANQTSADDKSTSFCEFRGEPVMCGPRGLKGEPDHLFHNNGDGTFTDVSEKAGVADKNAYYGLASAFVDINNDGKLDLLVGNDSTPNYLYINKGDGTFEDASYPSGYALNENGRETATMGIAIGDYQNNGLLDLYNTTFSDDYNPLYRNDGDANFTDISYQMGIAEPTIPFLGWGTAFFDYDNDGWKDIIISNGHVYPTVDSKPWGTSWAQRPLLFHNIEGKKFDLVPAVEGTGLAIVVRGRGLAVGDLFNDGKLDAVINVLDGHPVLLRNVSPDTHHWIELRLIGGPKSPRDAVGATVYLTAAGKRQRGDVISGGSYASTHDPRIHFGIGDATAIDNLEVHWPSGTIEKFAIAKPDQIVTLTEGKGEPTTAKKP
ncbi:VCBS repeat protein [Edaphobacter aggregans]|uniref:VCBS repeat protein n=1 Tax=Edaphobacter aggregans TaxID=570835 RepID=A0A3R9QCS0_9BACT|nr:VCBS repeat protein [Edaphobacter aggregans]